MFDDMQPTEYILTTRYLDLESNLVVSAGYQAYNLAINLNG